jgi:hypothetical protein
VKINRRSILTGIIAAPVVIAYKTLMPVKAQPLVGDLTHILPEHSRQIIEAVMATMIDPMLLLNRGTPMGFRAQQTLPEDMTFESTQFSYPDLNRQINPTKFWNRK